MPAPCPFWPATTRIEGLLPAGDRGAIFDPYPTADLVADVNQMNRMVEQQQPLPSSTCGFSRSSKPRSTIRGEDGLYEAGIAASARSCHPGTLIDTATHGRFGDRGRQAAKRANGMQNKVQIKVKGRSLKFQNRIQPLVDDGLVDDVISRLMSGKEADVYVVRCGDEIRCAKV